MHSLEIDSGLETRPAEILTAGLYSPDEIAALQQAAEETGDGMSFEFLNPTDAGDASTYADTLLSQDESLRAAGFNIGTRTLDDILKEIKNGTDNTDRLPVIIRSERPAHLEFWARYAGLIETDAEVA
jgi:hypothetical protein